MARGASALMSHWGHKYGPPKVSLVVATLLTGAVLGKAQVPGLLPCCSLPLISCFVSKSVSHSHTHAAITARGI